MPVFQLQSHASGAGFYLLQLRVVISNALGKNADRFAGFEHPITSLERIGHRAHRLGIIANSVDGDDAALSQKPLHGTEPEELDGRDEMDFAWNGCSNDERIGYGVGMVGRK